MPKEQEVETVEVEVAEETEKVDDIENEIAKLPDYAEGDETTKDGEGKEAEDAAETEVVEAEEGGEKDGEAVEVSEKDKEFEVLKAQNEEFQQRFDKLETDKVNAEANKPRTEEEWTALEEKTGSSRGTIEHFENESRTNMVAVARSVKNYVDTMFGGLERDKIIGELASDKEFSDIKSYRKDIDGFLKDIKQENTRDPELIKKAAIYARGKNSKNAVKKAQNTTIKTQKVAMGNKHGKGGGGKKTVTLKKDAGYYLAKSQGMTDEEQIKYGSKTTFGQ